MIKATADNDKVTMSINGNLSELTVDSMMILKAVYEAICEHDKDNDAGERYREFIIENIDMAFKEKDEVVAATLNKVMEFLEKLCGDED